MRANLFPNVVVNGETVPSAVVAAEAQNHAAPAGKPGLAWRRAADAVAIRVLLRQEAERRGLRAVPRITGPGRVESEEEALIRGLLEQAVVAAAPSVEAVRAEYDARPDRYATAPLREVSHILFAADPADAEADRQAHAAAVETAGLALGDPARFAALARARSDCPSAAQGGALGQLRPGDVVPEFDAALETMQQGEVSAEPVRTRHGWHVIRLDALAPSRRLPFETAAPKIAVAMEKAAWARAARGFVADLASRAEIEGAAPGRAC